MEVITTKGNGTIIITVGDRMEIIRRRLRHARSVVRTK